MHGGAKTLPGHTAAKGPGPQSQKGADGRLDETRTHHGRKEQGVGRDTCRGAQSRPSSGKCTRKPPGTRREALVRSRRKGNSTPSGGSVRGCTWENHVAEATKAAQARAQDPAILLHTQPKRELVSPKGPIRYPKVHGSIIPDRPKQPKCHSTAEWRDQNSAEPWKEGLLLATRLNVTDNVRESCPIAGTSPPPPPSALVLAKPPCLGGGAGGCSSHSGSNANLLPHLQLGSQHSLSP